MMSFKQFTKLNPMVTARSKKFALTDQSEDVDTRLYPELSSKRLEEPCEPTSDQSNLNSSSK